MQKCQTRLGSKFEEVLPLECMLTLDYTVWGLSRYALTGIGTVFLAINQKSDPVLSAPLLGVLSKPPIP